MSIQRIAIFVPLAALLLGTTFAPSEDDAGYAHRSPRGDGVELGARCESDPAAHAALEYRTPETERAFDPGIP